MLTRIALIGLLALSASAYGQGPGPARGGRGPGRPGIAGMPPEARLVGAFAGAPGQVVKANRLIFLSERLGRGA